MQHYLVRFSDTKARADWNPAEKMVFDAHVKYLKQKEAEGSLRYAGLAKKPSSGALSFGYALYQAASWQEAVQLMEEDPGVKEKLLLGQIEQLEKFLGQAP